MEGPKFRKKREAKVKQKDKGSVYSQKHIRIIQSQQSNKKEQTTPTDE